MEHRTEKFTIRFTPSEARQLDDWRAACHPIPSRAELVRSIVLEVLNDDGVLPTEEAREGLPQ